MWWPMALTAGLAAASALAWCSAVGGRALLARQRYRHARLSLPYPLRMEVGHSLSQGYRLQSWDGTTAYLSRDRGVRSWLRSVQHVALRGPVHPSQPSWLRLQLDADGRRVAREHLTGPLRKS